MTRRIAAAVLWIAVASGCAAARSRPGTGEVRGFVYADDAGLTVVTTEAAVAQPVAKHADVHGHFVVDYLHIVPPSAEQTVIHAHQSSGHGVDTVSGASARVAGGAETEKARVEVGVGAAVDVPVEDAPVDLSLDARLSAESDYLSLSSTLRGTVSLFQQNTTLGALFGYGHDTVSPDEAPAGQKDDWPATHQRIQGGLTLGQVLSPSIVGSAGLSLTHQFGTLESPYRRALVRTTLFPEHVPDQRTRVTAFAGVRWYVGLGFALDLRQGLYADSWGVLGAVPEVSVLKAAGDRWLFSARWRWYAQGRADFYRARYDDLAEEMSSDPRLGRTSEHAPGIALRWTPVGDRGDFGALTLDASYDLSIVEYTSAALPTVIGHVVGLGAHLSY